MSDYVMPEAGKDAFHCPHCGSFSDQFYGELRATDTRYITKLSFNVSRCRRCNDVAIWKDAKMIFPITGNAPLPNPDMADEIKKDYLEARDIVAFSPRSACTLLRLCVEKICDEKVPGGGDLNEKIGKLIQQGLDDKIAKALDSVRVIGGQAVHHLQMDLRDDTSTATALFEIVNYISDWAYTRAKKIDNIYDTLPEDKKVAIERRDRK